MEPISQTQKATGAGRSKQKMTIQDALGILPIAAHGLWTTDDGADQSYITHEMSAVDDGTDDQTSLITAADSSDPRQSILTQY